MKTEVVLSKEIKNLVVGIEFIPTFAVLTDGDCIHFAGQAVNLLNLVIGHFLCPKIKYWRLPIRRYCMLSGVVHHLLAAYMVTAFLLPITYL